MLSISKYSSLVLRVRRIQQWIYEVLGKQNVILNPYSLFHESLRYIVFADSTSNIACLENDVSYLQSLPEGKKMLLIADSNLDFDQALMSRCDFILFREGMSRDELSSVLVQIVEFCPDCSIIRAEGVTGVLKKLVSKIEPVVRISFGDSVPYPHCNLRLQDEQTRLVDHFSIT